MEEERWLRIDRSGFFPLDGESETAFELSYHELFVTCPTRQSASCSWLIPAQKKFFHFFHTVPCWVVPSLGKKGLTPWEMAACWQYSNGRSDLIAKPKILDLPEEERKEILFHELMHASRARIQSLCFEEILAYEAMRQEKTSPFASIRGVLSRLFVAPSDVSFALIWHLILLLLSLLNVFSFSTYFLLIFFFWGALAGRACWLFRIWKKAFKAIEKAFPEKGWRFLLRASDSDVFWLASLPPQEVFDSIMEKASYDWRWKYFVVCTLS